MPNFLHDAIVFHKDLNPALWHDGDMKPEIREALLAMAAEFQESLGIEALDLQDITVSGSNAAYTYTPHSDIDLHLVVKIPEDQDQLYTELFDAKKNLYNVTHNQKVKGFDVEFYVQNMNNPVESIGIYSVLKGKWISYPKKVMATIDDLSILSKVATYTERIKQALHNDDFELAKKTWDDLKAMRKAGLEEGGEFSPENLAFKIIRTRGLSKQLYDHMIAIKDRQLSVESLQEAFDNPPEFKMTRDNLAQLELRATIGDREIFFQAQSQGAVDGKDVWEISFWEEGEDEDGVLRATSKATGSGNEFQVFALVKRGIDLLIQKRDPDVLMFSAVKEGNSRSSLYSKMVKKLAPVGWISRESDSSQKTNFWIEKIQ